MTARSARKLHYVVIGCTLGVATADFLFDYNFGGFYPGFGFRLIIDLVLAFGLLVQSKLARFTGAAYFALTAISMVWPVFASGQYEWGIALAWIIAVTLLSAVNVYLLVLSKAFASEFEALRAFDPNGYKRSLRIVFMALLAGGAVAVTLHDVYNLVMG